MSETMPVVNVNLVLDDKTYAAVKAGVYELGGLVKDNKHIIRKHLPTVVDSAKDVRVQKSKANQMVIDSNNEKVVIISQLTGGKRQDGTPSWDWVTLHSEQYFSVDLPLPDIHYHAIPFKEKHEAINMVKWINTDVVGFIVYHYKFNVSNTQTMMNRIPQPPKTNGDFSDEVIKRTFGLSDEEIEWIHSEI